MHRSPQLKRAVDLVLCLAALPLVVPLALCIALAIKATSPGPVLFRAPRVGRDKQPFTVLKCSPRNS